ncbi:MAG: class I SAM-dependent methyltransferase, partial [Pseudomonadota bacterium]
EAYSFQILPRVGAVVAGDREAYQYLAESIRRFPKQSALEALMREAGFSRVKHTNLSGGITAIHTGRRL